VISDAQGQSGGQSGVDEVAQMGESTSPNAMPERVLDPIAIALASALAEAAKTGRWDIVANLLKELEARRR
jgi:hypothetical protein